MVENSEVSIGFWMCHCCLQLPTSNSHHSWLSMRHSWHVHVQRLLKTTLAAVRHMSPDQKHPKTMIGSWWLKTTLPIHTSSRLLHGLISIQASGVQEPTKALSGVSIGFWMCHCCLQLPASNSHHSWLSRRQSWHVHVQRFLKTTFAAVRHTSPDQKHPKTTIGSWWLKATLPIYHLYK